MNMEQIKSGVAKKTGLTKAQAKEAYEAIVELLIEELNEDPKAKKATVTLPKIGKIKANFKNEYMGFNPQKKEKMKIGASRRIYFSASKSLKDKVNDVL